MGEPTKPRDLHLEFPEKLNILEDESESNHVSVDGGGASVRTAAIVR